MEPLPLPSWILPYDTATPSTAIEYLIRNHIAQIGPPMFAEVVAFYEGIDQASGTVDVRPMVHQQDAAGRPYPHGVIYNVPCLQLQGGNSAIILNPKPGDIGFIVVSGRDHSGVVATKKAAPPGSFRQFDLSDSVFIGTFLTAAPTQYIQFTDQGINIVATGPITLHADSVQISGNLKVDGDVTAGNISLTNHVHSGVQTGSGMSGAPE